jgi:hypothetical protein
MKAMIELHFQHEAENVLRSTLPRFIDNVLLSTLSYPNETSKECIQFLILWHSSPFDVKSYQSNVNIYVLFHWHSSPLHLIYFLMFFISPQKYHVPFLMNVPNEKPFQTIGWTACFFILFITYIVVIHMMYNRVLYIWSWFFPVTVLYMILILPRHYLIYDPDSSPSLSYIWYWFFPGAVLYMILILPRHCLIYEPDSSPSLSYIWSWFFPVSPK